MDNRKEPQVGCENENGQLIIHNESTTCEVCAPTKTHNLPGENRIRELMKQVGMENSRSLYLAFNQLIKETVLYHESKTNFVPDPRMQEHETFCMKYMAEKLQGIPFKKD